MSSSLTSKFTIGFSDLIVWVDNKTCLNCGNKKKKKQKIESFLKDESSKLDLKEKKESSIHSSHNSSLKDSLINSNNKIKNIKTKFRLSLLEEDLQNFSNEPRFEIGILKNITGVIGSGEMTAIIGSSGSGKTTLMNFLSSRSTWDPNMYVDGKMYLNGQPVKTLSKYKHLIGYVPQEDILLEDQTVRGNFERYGRLRAYKNYKAKAQKFIELMGLEKCADTIVGGGLIRGISGGEKKRVSIGVELMSNPKILFLDEPTSGIDAYTAFEVVQNLKNLNDEKNVGIVAVLHQPRQEIIDLFDKV